jgi:hypothetical protein
MKIPCNECIVYAICKSKTQIVCRELFEWALDNKLIKDTELKRYIPNWDIIEPEKDAHLFIIINKIDNDEMLDLIRNTWNEWKNYEAKRIK